MLRAKKFRFTLVAALGVLAMVMGALVACDDDKPGNTTPDPDSGEKSDVFRPADQYIPPDLPPKPDVPIWPDTKPPADTQPWPQPDGYVGGAFGCQSDSDCFGQKCCTTPWGVKLCAASCDF